MSFVFSLNLGDLALYFVALKMVSFEDNLLIFHGFCLNLIMSLSLLIKTIA